VSNSIFATYDSILLTLLFCNLPRSPGDGLGDGPGDGPGDGNADGPGDGPGDGTDDGPVDGRRVSGDVGGGGGLHSSSRNVQ